MGFEISEQVTARRPREASKVYVKIDLLGQ